MTRITPFSRYEFNLDESLSGMGAYRERVIEPLQAIIKPTQDRMQQEFDALVKGFMDSFEGDMMPGHGKPGTKET